MAVRHHTEFFKYVANACYSPLRYGPQFVERTKIETRLRTLFHELKLPEPMGDEFNHGTGNRGFAFMHQAGCVLRVVSNKEFPLLRHKHIMRPIGSVELNAEIRLDIQFAGECPVKQDDNDKVDRTFEQASLEVIDSSPNNLCYTALKTEQFPNGVPVIFDPAQITCLPLLIDDEFLQEGCAIVTPRNILQSTARKGALVDLNPQAGEKPDEQDISYADLREKFTNMFDLDVDADQIKLDPGAVDRFWNAMKASTREGHLNPSWMDKKPGYCTLDFKASSERYAARLSAHNPVFAENSLDTLDI